MESIDFGGKPSDHTVSHDIPIACCDHYSKRVTELWFNVRHAIESGQMRGMSEDLVNEGASREWGMVGNNKIEVEPKSEMKKKTGRSPDLFDALAAGLYGAIRLGFVIRRLTAPVSVKTDQKWKQELRDKSREFWKAGQLVNA